MKVELVLAWPRDYERVEVDLPVRATLGDALQAARWAEREGVSGYAVFGVAATAVTVLQDGDRVELLRPLQADPKEARRKRAAKRGR